MSDLRRIIITGGSSGIGRAAAIELASSERTFFLVGRNESRLQDVMKEVQSRGASCHYGIGDVGSAEEIERLFEEAMAKLSTVDVLIANAGVGHFGNLEEITIEQFDSQFRTNVRGVFLWLRKVLPIMKQNKAGQVIVTSSHLGLHTAPRASIYAATKHAVQAMVWSLREELKGTGVKAATINPGAVSTPWFDGRDVDRSKMLAASDVAKAIRMIVEQDATSDIDHIHLMPANR